jgi:hypothetical protein
MYNDNPANLKPLLPDEKLNIWVRFELGQFLGLKKSVRRWKMSTEIKTLREAEFHLKKYRDLNMRLSDPKHRKISSSRHHIL